MIADVEISGRAIGKGYPCFIIAEAGVNHDGNLDVAKRLVDAAVEAGADAVKFQTFDPNKLATSMAPKAAYQKETTDLDESQLDMLHRLRLSREAHRHLIEHCRQRNIIFLSTPFEEDSADFLEGLGLPALKIGSGDLTNLPFLEHVARKGLPLIVSTGMATLGEVEAALSVIEATGNQRIVVLHCVSRYPADAVDVNLRAMQTMARAFDIPVGYSDHTTGIEVALAAVALGACVIEKHLTLDRTQPGPDHRASLESDELAMMIAGIRTVEAALGKGRKRPTASEAEIAAVARKSLVAATDIRTGTLLTSEMVTARRPGTGLAPSMREHIVGRSARVEIREGMLIKLEMLT